MLDFLKKIILFCLILIFLGFQTAIGFDYSKTAPADSSDVESLISEGYGFIEDGFYHLAIIKFERALKNAMTSKDKVKCLVGIGLGKQRWRKHQDAENKYNEALFLSNTLNEPELTSRIHFLLGLLLKDIGRFKEALSQFEAIITLADQNDLLREKSKALHLKGEIFQAWGAFEKAGKLYSLSLELANTINSIENIGINLNALGDLDFFNKRFDLAKEKYFKAIAINAKHQMDELNITTYLKLGRLSSHSKEYENAVEYYQKSLMLSRKKADFDSLIEGIQGVGRLRYAQGRIDEARNFYEMGLLLAKEHHLMPLAADLQNDIGICDYTLEKFDSSIINFKASIEIKEDLRLSAIGALRRNYLASQIDTYHWLTSAYIKTQRPLTAFEVIELSTAKYLIEQMGDKYGSTQKFKGVDLYLKQLSKQSAVVSYTMNGGSLVIGTKDSIKGTFFDLTSLTKTDEKPFEPFMSMALEKNKDTLTVINEDQGIYIGKQGVATLSKLIRYYRILLSSASAKRKLNQHRNAIGKLLYNLLLAPAKEMLLNKKEIVIMPDGILNFLPFETLIMPDGRYLVEAYTIKYVQSLSVASLIDSRKYQSNRNSLIGFGGAVYSSESYTSDMLVSQNLLASIRQRSIMNHKKGLNVRNAFEVLGIGNFKNLPGTLAEVKAINSVVPGSTIFTGNQVSELRIKQLSKNGDLKKYKNIHFATHGIVVPEIPELSSLILSTQGNVKDDANDGFLTMSEIIDLEFNADFVNLSACQTGLGKIYGGEGVVGLTQSFLIAGANSLSVSLWSVADESTMRFMTGLYSLVSNKGMSYAEAMSEMKRAFINSRKMDDKKNFSHPFFWAPFIYYGKIL